jgi:hypothetical protein
MEPPAVSHSRPIPCYNVYIHSLIHSSRPVHSINGTSCGFSPKTHILIQKLHQLINTRRQKNCNNHSWLLAPYQSRSGHETCNSSILLDPSSQLTEPPAVSHPRCTPDIKLHTLIKTIRIMNCDHNSWLMAQYQSRSGHYTGTSSILLDPSSQLTEPPTVSHPRPAS